MIVARSQDCFNDTLPVKEGQREKTFCSVIVAKFLNLKINVFVILYLGYIDLFRLCYTISVQEMKNLFYHIIKLKNSLYNCVNEMIR